MPLPSRTRSKVLPDSAEPSDKATAASYRDNPNTDFQSFPPDPAVDGRPRSSWGLFAVSTILTFFLITLTTSFLFCSPLSTFCAAEPSTFQLALQCAQAKPAGAPCETRRCFDAFVASAGKLEEEQREGELLVRGLDQLCNRQNDDNAADQARDCFAAQTSMPCETSRNCLDTYTSKFPNGAYRTELDRTLSSVLEKCVSSHAAKSQVPAAQLTPYSVDAEVTDDNTAYNIAKTCEIEAQSAARGACYEAYLSKFPQGIHAADAKQAVALAGTARVVPVSDGFYKGFAATGCHEEAGGAINVIVRARTLRWEHYVGEAKHEWIGRVEPDGMITAKAQDVPEASATGQFSDDGLKEIDLRYPECKATIQARFYGRRPE